MADENEEGLPGGCIITLFLLPVFVAVGIGITSMTKKLDPAHTRVSAGEMSAFEAQEEEGTGVELSSAAEDGVQSSSAAVAADSAITLQSVENLAGKPISLRKLLNSPEKVDALLAGQDAIALLTSKSKLERFLSASPEVGLFLFGPAITALSGDRRSLDAALGSQLVGRIGNSKAVQGLLHDGKAIARILKANPQLAAFLKQTEVSESLLSFSKSGVLEGLDSPAFAEAIGKGAPAEPKPGSARR